MSSEVGCANGVSLISVVVANRFVAKKVVLVLHEKTYFTVEAKLGTFVSAGSGSGLENAGAKMIQIVRSTSRLEMPNILKIYRDGASLRH